MSLVVILRGSSGVGKSTIARLVEKELKPDWVIIDVDKFKNYMPLKDDNGSHYKGSEDRKARSTIAHNVSHFFAKQYSKERDKYTEAKTDFIKKVMDKVIAP